MGEQLADEKPTAPQEQITEKVVHERRSRLSERAQGLETKINTECDAIVRETQRRTSTTVNTSGDDIYDYERTTRSTSTTSRERLEAPDENVEYEDTTREVKREPRPKSEWENRDMHVNICRRCKTKVCSKLRIWRVGSRKRHHCRNCGFVVCGKCSVKNIEFANGTKARVCIPCLRIPNWP